MYEKWGGFFFYTTSCQHHKVTSNIIPASSRYLAGWGSLWETSARWIIWKIWNTFETWNVRKGCFTSWIHNAPFMWREICHIEMKCTPFECTAPPQPLAYNPPLLLPTFIIIFLSRCAPQWTIIKVFFSTEIWLVWLKHDGLAKIRSTPRHSDMCGGKKNPLSKSTSKKGSEKGSFFTRIREIS